jgi:hypothetical protein
MVAYFEKIVPILLFLKYRHVYENFGVPTQFLQYSQHIFSPEYHNFKNSRFSGMRVSGSYPGVALLPSH